MIFEILFVLVVMFVLYLAFISIWKPRNFPPGPIGLPFVGSLHLILPDVSQSMPKFFEKYGDIFSLKLKEKNIVCISGYELIKEVMIDRPKPFSDRTKFLSQKLTRGDKLDGIAAAPYGPKWSAHRKWFNTVIRKMDLGKNYISQIITEEVPYFIDELQNQQQLNQDIDPSKVFESSILNVLACFVFGNRYSYGNEKFQRLIFLNNKFFEYQMTAPTLTFFLVSLVPFLHKFWLPTNTKRMVQCSREIEDFIAAEVDYHKSTLDPKSPRDLIDHYLITLSHQTSGCYSKQGLLKTIMDIFQGGTDTMSATLKWAVLYMANNPEIQKKVQGEIDEVLDNNRLPKYEDRIKMPYTQATIMEVQRKGNVTPIGIYHATNENEKLQGYKLPKGTCIFPSFASIHHSPAYWKNPNHFDPENFLDPNGEVGTRPTFMPFGGGLRICVGMNIAKQELFLFFVAMMQHFTFSPPSGVTKLSEEYVVGGTLHPKPYQVVIRKRM